jgi:dolichyl-phosphate-mannose-protein mannosyltransferase
VSEAASAARRVAGWFTTPWGLAALFAAGLLLRLLLAPHTGEHDDLGEYFRPWATRLAQVGPSHFYDGYVADPPGYLLILWPLGVLARTLHEPSPSTLLLKLPSIASDLGLAWIASLVAVRVTPAFVATPRAVRTVVSVAILFNPAVVWISSVWGQADTVGAFLLMCALALLFTGDRRVGVELSGMALLGLAIAVKPQMALAAPAVALALVWRHLGGPGARRTMWGSLVGAARGLVAGGIFLIAWGATGIPFGLSIPETLHRYVGHTSINDWTGMWSYNLWGILGPWQHDVAGDVVLYVAGIPALYVGLILFALAISLALYLAWRRLSAGDDERAVLLFAAAASAGVGFALLTRMWERYLLVTLVCLAPLIFFRPLGRVFVGLSSALFASDYYHYVFGAQLRHARDFLVEPIYGWLLGGDAVDAWQRKMISAIVLVALLWLAFRGWASVRSNQRRSSSPPIRQPIQTTIDRT